MADQDPVELNLSEILVGEHDVRSVEEDPELVDLANSIAQVGLINPLTVELREGRYHLAAGHRRYAACVIARVVRVKVEVRHGGVAEAKEISFAENFHRKDITVLEEAIAIRDVLESGSMTVDGVARVFHRSVDWVKQQLGILGWPDDVLAVLRSRGLSVSALSNLAKVEDDANRRFLLDAAVANGASEATTAIWLQGWRANRPVEALSQETASPAGGGHEVRVPMSLCMACRREVRPDGLVMVYVCLECSQMIRSGGAAAS